MIFSSFFGESSGQTLPWSIHARRIPTSSAFSGAPSGGMTACGSTPATRAISRLRSLSPAEITWPRSPPFSRASRLSNRNPDSCFFAPWQPQQFFSKSGRTSFAKSIFRSAGGGSLSAAKDSEPMTTSVVANRMSRGVIRRSPKAGGKRGVGRDHLPSIASDRGRRHETFCRAISREESLLWKCQGTHECESLAECPGAD